MTLYVIPPDEIPRYSSFDIEAFDELNLECFKGSLQCLRAVGGSTFIRIPKEMSAEDRENAIFHLDQLYSLSM